MNTPQIRTMCPSCGIDIGKPLEHGMCLRCYLLGDGSEDAPRANPDRRRAGNSVALHDIKYNGDRFASGEW